MADELLSHLLIAGRVRGIPFKPPLAVPRKHKYNRNVGEHGRRLLAQLDELAASIGVLEAVREALELPLQRGMSIAVEFTPRGKFDCSKVDWSQDKIELLTVQAHTNSDIAVLHIPDGKLAALVRRIRDYVETENEPTIKQAALVDAIENIKRAAFGEMWTDPGDPPTDGKKHWFQVWLRHSHGNAGDIVEEFTQLSARVGIQTDPGYVAFPGRLVVAALGTKEAFEQAVELLDLIAEIRPVEPTAEFFLSKLSQSEQADWTKDLLSRTTFPDGEAPHLCLMDTGVNHGHPLLAPALADEDMHTYDPAWQKADHAGHGSEMAGIAVWGDLTKPLSSDNEVLVPHRLESVKILPPVGQTAPKLWGKVTAESVYRVEVTAAERSRVFAMMTTTVGHLLGLPSEWSATIDQLAFGRPAVDVANVGRAKQQPVRVPRLFVLSAGNVPWADWGEYPASNHKSPIQNPAQAWNVLTVGAATALTEIDNKTYPDLKPLATAGDLSPSSTTSLLWSNTAWPLKPDVVAEGGNASRDKYSVTVGPDALRVLTTSDTPTAALFAATGDTSAAAAEVARLCAHLRAEYPDYWPETIRALVVHGADHTPAMREPFPKVLKQDHKDRLLRMYGFGLVNHDSAQFSTAHRPTLVVQRSFAPYQRQVGGYIGSGPMQLHDLPWPADELKHISEKQVELRVTLSYFVEPNPSARGWLSKFRYQSFGLRFLVKGASEDDAQFLLRVNRQAREELSEEELEDEYNDPDVKYWRYGPKIRTRGSVHSDVWTGTAEQLAAKNQIAIVPVGGWWKYWKSAKQYGMEARYALVVSLRVDEDVDTDVYTPIVTILAPAAVIDIDVDGGDEDLL
ncbi:peptidase S8 [Paraburkholderia ginsengiterrae]|uniref:Peptidase S8 n=1 Tax=Paraburkholderia ginsengiterrae TaxID=1462993 RepID=A0A1A9NCA0_9BURK|nr:S8 family peptidase [Paraburkholderia ginsengiterrae]OAJ60774.1 peptidase S8 [Paraburkholderia ginsengiterrae]OAJ64331.1 peptidase S8 [Paraburkholderia ginsengiterrae]